MSFTNFNQEDNAVTASMDARIRLKLYPVSAKYVASSLPRFTIVKLNDKNYVLENGMRGQWANLIYEENGVRKGKQIPKTQMLEVVYYPAQSAFKLLEILNKPEK